MGKGVGKMKRFFGDLENVICRSLQKIVMGG